MIVVIGRVVTDAAKRAELIEVAQGVAAASREEAGCAGYRFYEDTERPDHFVFVEEWESEEALQRHFRTPHIAAFMKAIPATIVAAPDVTFHQVASSRDLSQVAAGAGA